MSVTPLLKWPIPPNGDFSRALWVWKKDVSLNTDADQQRLLDHCGATGITTLFLSTAPYLAPGNATAASIAHMAQFVDAAKKSGMNVFAVGGDVAWGTQQSVAMHDLVNPVLAFNAMAPKPFDGFCLDVEYWVDSAHLSAKEQCPALCDLLKAIRLRSGLLVGCTAGFFLIKPDRVINYANVIKPEGQHLVDSADFVVPMVYRDTSQGITMLAQPWFDYASAPGRNKLWYIGIETNNVAPAQPESITFYGQGRAYMEQQLTEVSAHFNTMGPSSSYLGIAVHSYAGSLALK